MKGIENKPCGWCKEKTKEATHCYVYKKQTVYVCTGCAEYLNIDTDEYKIKVQRGQKSLFE